MLNAVWLCRALQLSSDASCSSSSSAQYLLRRVPLCCCYKAPGCCHLCHVLPLCCCLSQQARAARPHPMLPCAARRASWGSHCCSGCCRSKRCSSNNKNSSSSRSTNSRSRSSSRQPVSVCLSDAGWCHECEHACARSNSHMYKQLQ